VDPSQTPVALPYLAQRPRYRRSGRVDWVYFIPLAGLVLIAAAGLAVVLHLAFVHGVYYIIFTPALLALPLTGLVAVAVGLGRCRSRLVAAALGLAAAAVFYLGHFHAGLVSEIGIENIHRLDILPEYIQFRMENEVQTETPGHGPIGRDPTVSPGMNWFMFSVEAALSVWLCSIAAVGRAARAYCEQCGAWKERGLAFFKPGSSRKVIELLDAGRLSGLEQLPRLTPDPHNRRYTAVGAEYCPPPKDLPLEVPGHLAVTCPVFLSVKEVKYGGGYGSGMMFDWSVGGMKAPRVELTPYEVRELARVFPGLDRIAPPAPAAPVAEDESDEDEGEAAPPGALASITDVPPRIAGKVLTRGATVMGNVLTLSSLLLVLAGLGLAAWGVITISFAFDAHRPTSPSAILGWAMVAVGAPLGAVSAFVGLRNPSVFGNRYLRRRTRAEFDLRHDRIVNPSDPAAVFIEVVPRVNWGRATLETATDVGYLLVDPRGGQVLFEGDNQRWRIPASSVLEVTAEPATAGQGTIGEVPHYMCVVRVGAPAAATELCFCPRQTGWRLSKDHRERVAMELARQIAALKGSA
jgi:hypothetical protein